MKRAATLLSFFCLVLAASSGCAHYSKGPWSGRVIDADTKEPIEGAVVVAVWNEDYAAAIQRGTAFRDAVETFTDQQGHFEIGAKSFFTMLPDGKIEGPNITIFKPGYGTFPRYQVSPRGKTQGIFEKPDTIVELPKSDDREERRMWLHEAESIINDSTEARLKKLKKATNIESKNLGLPTLPESGGE